MDRLLKIVSIIEKTVYMGVAITATCVLLNLELIAEKIANRGILLSHIQVDPSKYTTEDDIPNVFKPKKYNKKSSPRPRDRRYY